MRAWGTAVVVSAALGLAVLLPSGGDAPSTAVSPNVFRRGIAGKRLDYVFYTMGERATAGGAHVATPALP